MDLIDGLFEFVAVICRHRLSLDRYPAGAPQDEEIAGENTQ
jgi:hypothetical protein